MANTENVLKPRKGQLVYQGRVVSDKMDKTIVVEVTNRAVHRLYKKYMTVSKRLKAHDEANEAHTGDTVRVVSARPMSKEKRWRLLEIVERAR
ncbi:MAG: 30S ribosomal protein S17 [Spirochaetota bacterium]